MICGPSGSGKSTLIRCINGLEQHDGGVIRVLGKTIDRETDQIDDIRRDVGMVFQHFNLFPPHDRAGELHLGTDAGAQDRCVRRQRRQQCTFLTRCISRIRPSNIRGSFLVASNNGFAIARSLTMQPRILLFDEPDIGP